LGEDGKLIAIVEEADANTAQKGINVINTGIYVVKRRFLNLALPLIGSDNAQKEVYLTDIIAIGHRQCKKMGILIGDDSNEIIGVNSLEDLQQAEKIMKRRDNEKS
jgi:bifunctional N-acetylglucosamine-1-phosphate-uridyltransferase/glucosamine-1-phosphate-acetyltransferase GlmU-like protein